MTDDNDNILPLDVHTIARNAAARARAGHDKHLPLLRALPAAAPFPLGALGELRGPVEAVAAITQTPVGMCAQSVLAAVALATSPCKDVELPGIGRTGTNLFLGSVAVSGERKSSVDKLVCDPIVRRERAWRDTYESDVYRAKSDHDVWEFRRKAIRTRCKKTNDMEKMR